MTKRIWSFRQLVLSETGILLLLAVLKLVIHLCINGSGGYGFFRDEFYYIACSDHLDFGYVDHPPLSIVWLAFSRLLLGDSLIAIRFLPALTGALTVFLVGIMVRELGGGRFAQILAALSIIAAPYYLGIHGYYSMNSYDLLFWTAGGYVIILLITRENPRLWLLLGLIIGLGLLNKISMLWFASGLAIGLLISHRRKDLGTPWPWLAALIAALLFLPHVLWQIKWGWPTLEFIQRATGEKMAAISPVRFIIEQILNMHPVLLPVWLTGLLFVVFSRRGKPFRILGIIYLTVFLLLLINQKSRPGYLAPSYPFLFAAGALAIETWMSSKRRQWMKPTLIVVVLIGGIITAPLALPVLPVESYIAYARIIGIQPSTDEKKEIGKLPQFFADMHGWEEMVAVVAGVFNSLSPEEKSECRIFAGNYGEAGAVDFLGKKYNLPGAISDHNNYWLWGPGDTSGETIIFLGGSEERLKEVFVYVEKAAVFTNAYVMPYENDLPIYVCKGLKTPLEVLWPQAKHFE